MKTEHAARQERWKVKNKAIVLMFLELFLYHSVQRKEHFHGVLWVVRSHCADIPVTRPGHWPGSSGLTGNSQQARLQSLTWATVKNYRSLAPPRRPQFRQSGEGLLKSSPHQVTVICGQAKNYWPTISNHLKASAAHLVWQTFPPWYWRLASRTATVNNQLGDSLNLSYR